MFLPLLLTLIMSPQVMPQGKIKFCYFTFNEQAGRVVLNYYTGNVHVNEYLKIFYSVELEIPLYINNVK